MVWIPRFVNHTENELPYKEGPIALSIAVGCTISGRQVVMNIDKAVLRSAHKLLAVHKWYNVSTEYENVHEKLIIHYHLTIHSKILILISGTRFIYTPRQRPLKQSYKSTLLYYVRMYMYYITCIQWNPSIRTPLK